MKLKTQLRIKSYSKETLSLYIAYLQGIFFKLKLSTSVFNFPQKKKIITLLKSPHVNKKAKEQFEIKYFKASISFKNSVSLSLIKNILTNKPKSVSLKIKI
jgi:small subunit ribosomal protein S10